MNVKNFLIAAIVCTVALCSNSAQSQEHQHHTGKHTKLTLNHGKKWNSDAPLRQSMDTLRSAFQQKLEGNHHAISKADFKQLGEITHAEVSNMVANCKLTPEADAVLHQIIAEMMQGADVMTGKTKGKPENAAHKVIAALNNYGRLFDHPNWVVLK